MKTVLKISTIGLALAANSAMAEVSLRSHQATYLMKQTDLYGQNGSPIEHVEGVLRYKFTQSCDGWMVEHNTAMLMEYDTGQQAQMAWNYTSWEAKDGSKLRFHSTTKQNGVVTERYRGEARREGDKTIAIYAEPNGRRIEMPKKTFFPTAHQLKAMETAIEGEILFDAPYFDGSGEDASFDVSSVMTQYKGKQLTDVDGVALPPQPAWNIQLAFFKPGSQESEPEMEISARYRKDGISTRLLHNFGDFVLEGQLVELEYFPQEECR